MRGKKPSIIVLLALVAASAQAAAPTMQADVDPPTLVTLHAKAAALGDVIADVSRQSGVPIAVSSGFYTSTTDSPALPITLDLQHAPFWTAMAAICNQTNTDVRDNPDAYNTHLQIADACGEKFLGGPVDRCGLFTVEIGYWYRFKSAFSGRALTWPSPLFRIISMNRKPSKGKKSKPKKPPAPDVSQIALANVEKIIGGKLAQGMRLKR